MADGENSPGGDSLGRDLLGRELTPEEQRILEAYERLESLLELELPPTAEANVKEAIAALWQVVNGLALTDRRPGF